MLAADFMAHIFQGVTLPNIHVLTDALTLVAKLSHLEIKLVSFVIVARYIVTMNMVKQQRSIGAQNQRASATAQDLLVNGICSSIIEGFMGPS